MKRILLIKRQTILITALLFSVLTMYGESVDSLLLLTQSNDIKVKLDAYSKLGENRNLPSDDRINYSLKSLELAKEQKDKKAEAYANFIAGAAYTDAGNYDKAVFNLQASIQIYNSLNEKKLLVKALEVLGRTYFYLKQPNKSLEMLKESNAITIELGNPHEIGWSNNSLGNVYAIMGELDKALELFLKALTVLEDLQREENISKIYNNIANVYFAKGMMDQVLPYRLKALKLDRLANDERQISFKTYNLAEYYLAVNQAQNALPYIEESIELSEKLQDKELKLDNFKLLTEYYLLTNNSEKAQEYFKKSFALSDELFSKELSKQVGEMQALYDTEKAIKEKQIAHLNLSKSEQRKNVLFFLFLIAIILIAVLIYIYSQKRKFNGVLKSEVTQKTKELEAANSELKNNINLLIKAKEKAEESDRLKSAFLANMSHEIRTPMNGILGFTELLLNPNLSSEENKNYIHIVHNSGKRLLKTVNDIVEISKIEAGLLDVKNEETDFNIRINEIVEFFSKDASAKGLKLVIKELLPEADKKQITDQNKLNSILTNLTNNAIKFTESGTVTIGCRLNRSNVEFYINDTGIGIPKDRQKAIFERFIQADIADKNAYQGNGLGLSISKAYIEILGGSIWVESEEGKGSTFYFTVPLNKKENSKEELKQQFRKTKPWSNKLKILIAEDDIISRNYLSILIKDRAAQIIEARTGKETLELSKKHKDIDLILMDIEMPEINGYEATRIIRETNKEVIIIAQTAFGLSSDHEKAIKAGCNDYISKPISKTKLHVLIDKYFEN